MMAAQILFLLLHGPDGHEVRISPDSIVAMHSKKDDGDSKMFPPAANCLVNFSDGKSAAVVEECNYIHEQLESQT